MIKKAAVLTLLLALIGANAYAANLLRNAGFLNNGSGQAPDYWSWQAGPISRPDWPKCWQIDDQHYIAGTRSMRLSDNLGQPVDLLSMFFRLPPGQTYTFSAYLKADHEKATVQMVFGSVKSRRFTVGTTWQRYAITGTTSPTAQFHSCVRFTNPGNATIWVNAPQLELGTTATPFALAPADAMKPGSGRKPPQLVLPLPVLTCPVTTTPPRIDGRLDDKCWAHAAMAQNFRVLDSVAFAKQKTEAFITRDASNLYVAFRCHESQMNKLTARQTKRDANLFSDDVVEFFVSPHHDGRDHLQFAVNARGTIWDSLGSDNGWNCPGVEAKAGREPGAWTVELRIPFAGLGLPPDTDSVWRVNFARERAAPKPQELSTWAPVVRTFHQAARYGFLRGMDVKQLAQYFVKPGPTTPTMAPPPTPALVAYCDRSFYTTEPQANIVVRLVKPGPVEVTFQGRHQTAKVNQMGLVPLAIGDLACGEYPVQVQAAGMSQTVQLTKLPPQKNAVKIDRLHRMLIVGGKPFLPFATTAAKPAYVEDQANDGFNTILTLGHGANDIAGYQALFDTAQARGMKVIVWYNIGRGKSPQEWEDGLLQLIHHFKNEPALLAWYMIDEPPTSTDWLQQMFSKVKAADPYHPAFVNWCGRWQHVMDVKGGDFNSEDVYPIGRMSDDDAMKLIADSVTAMNRDATLSGKVVSFWHVFYGSYDSPREPTPLEEQCLTYTSLVHGCRALYYFLYKPMSVALWRSMLPLSKEITTLTPVLSGEDVTSQISDNNPAVHFAAFRQPDGAVYLIAVNTTDSPQQCRFHLGFKTAGQAQVMFENRQVACSDTLQDAFGKLARHVYVIR